MGDHDYARYVELHRRLHPGEPVPTEREYWRDRHAATDSNPGARCC
ncbi:YbdD/YjiX family protein [Rhodococcus sp. HM1]|nr:YbdD/YjiX family protein [Rhodococcus sp. HM1]